MVDLSPKLVVRKLTKKGFSEMKILFCFKEKFD